MPEIIRERLALVAGHCSVIEERLKGVADADSLRTEASANMLFDSLLTRLQALAENIKQIQKLDPDFFNRHLPIDVLPIIRFRDVVSHHYEAMNPDIVFAICKEEVPLLKRRVLKFLHGNLPA